MIINPYAFGVSYDPDAQAFFTASGLTGATNLTAINNLVVALKGFGIWTKMKAIYPFIGGTAALHKWNLKDPRDLNAAFRLVFNGGWTHSATGATPNGTNGYADTFLNTNSAFSVNDNMHISYYSRLTTGGIPDFVMGNQQSAINNGMALRRTDFGNITFFGINTATYFTSAAETTSTGLYIATRIGTTSNGFKNLVKIATTTNSASTRPNLPIFLGNSNVNGTPSPSQYTNKECAFSSIGDGLTDTEANNFYTAVQAYQTTLSRQVI